MIKILFAVLLSLSVLLSCLVIGQDHGQSNTSEKIDIHKICEINYDECLKKIPQYLNETTINSRLWFAYKLYQLEALFALEQLDELEELVTPLILQKNLPIKFKINSYVLYAKTIKRHGQNERAINYLNEAKDLLLAVNVDWPRPAELIKVANMLLSMGQYQIGFDMLLTLEERFKNYKDIIFNYQLYTNLGHFALRLNDLTLHTTYRMKTLEWVMLSENSNYKSIALFNVARAYFFSGSDELSLSYFKRVIPVAAQAKNHSVLASTYINMADIYLRNSDEKQANDLLYKVNFKNLNSGYLKRFEQLSQGVYTKKPGDKPGKE